MRRLAGISVLVVVLAVLGFSLFKSAPPAADQAATSPTPPPLSAEPARSASPATFGFVRVVTDLTKPQPGACLVFNRPLDAGSEAHYGDWVKLTPTADSR